MSGLGAGSELEITSAGTVVLDSATGGVSAADPLIVKLDAASNLTLSGMSFITAIGSSGPDTIQAGADFQTLTGGAGNNDFTFHAGHANGDVITDFSTTGQTDHVDFYGYGIGAHISQTGGNVSILNGSNALVDTITMGNSYNLAANPTSYAFH